MGVQNLIFFFGPQFRNDFSGQFLCEKSIFGPISGGKKNPLGPSFPFFSYFFVLPFFVFILVFFFFFLFSGSFLHFLFFFNVLHFLFSFIPKKKFVLFFFLVFLSIFFYCWR